MVGIVGRSAPSGERGLTAVEMLAALGVLMVLVSIAIPLARWDEKRRREEHLRLELRLMRDAIDQYKKLSDEGKIRQKDVDQRGYPLTLQDLVDGVEVSDSKTGKTTTVHFLNRIPTDPFTEEPEWGIRSYQDDWDSTSWGGENVYDVYSLSDGKALDGTYYKDW
jgi:general secretion pathway protein G